MFNRKNWILQKSVQSNYQYIRYQDVYDPNQAIELHYQNGQFLVCAYLYQYLPFENTLMNQGIEYHSQRHYPNSEAQMNCPNLVVSKWCLDPLDFSNFILPLAIQESMLPSVLQNITADVLQHHQSLSTPIFKM